MGTYGTSEEEFEKLVKETEKVLGRELTDEEIQQLKKTAE